MNRILFFFFAGFSWLLAHLPKRCMYIFADFLYIIAYYLIGYRKKVVQENLQKSFPEKTHTERRKIEKKFFRHLCDIIVEDIALFRMSEKRVKSFVTMHNFEPFTTDEYKDRDIITVLGHYGNWEFMVTFPLFQKLKIVSVYKPLSNHFLDKEVKAMRERFGGETLPMQQTLRGSLKLHQAPERFAIGLLSDQRPQREHSKLWLPFLNQETAILPGPDKIARKINAIVLFAHINKTKRGKYDISFELLTDNPTALPKDEISRLHTQKLEQIIQKEPAYWLWSHKRWKHKKSDCI